MIRKLGVDFHASRGMWQGSRTYVEGLYQALSRCSPPFAVRYFLDAAAAGAPPWMRPDQVTAFSSSNRYRRLLWDAPRQARRHRLDAFHFQYILPPVGGGAAILTIHDVLFEDYPEYFPLSFRVRLRTLCRWSARRARLVCTGSEYSRRRIIEHYGIAEDRIVVTPYGVDVAQFAIAVPAARAFARTRFGTDRYLLTVGRLEPRKNHQTLLRAYELLRSLQRDTPHLVIVGQRDHGYEGIFSEIAKRGLGENVVVVEDLSRAELVRAYRGSTLFVYPSYAEGFGIPPLEAMAAGVPVICSNTSAMAELYGDGSAVLFDPHSPEELAAAMRRLLGSPAEANALAERGRQLATRLSWERTARTFLTALERL